MLNRNKSQQRNMWKYGVIFPLIAAFLLIFNVKTVAQIRVVEKVKKGKNHDTEMIHFSIHKHTTDDELRALKKEIRNENGELSYKNLRRNSDGEITSIAIEFRNGEDGFVTGNYSGDDEGIQPIVFGNNGKGGLFINSGDEHDAEHHFEEYPGHRIHVKGHSSGGNYRIKVHSDDDDDDEHDNDGDNDDDIIIIKEANVNGKGGKQKFHKIKRKGNADHDVYVDEASDEEVIVIKKDKEGKRVKKSYKIKAKHSGDHDGDMLFLDVDDDDDVLFFVDGEESSKKKVEKLDTDDIEKIEVIKGDGATEKYGKKAKGGVVKITTKDRD